MSVHIWLATAILAVSLLRLYSLYRSDRWLWQEGPRYKVASKQLPEPILPSQRELLYDENGGNYFPFGVKGYRLAKWARKQRGWRKVFRIPLLIARRIWGFYYFCPLVSLYLIIVSRHGHVQSTDIEKWVQAAIAYLTIVWALLICAEGIIAYVRIESWGALYHGMGYKDIADNGGSMSELKVAAGAAFTTVIGTCAAFDFIAGRLGGFTEMDHEASWSRLGDSAYYSVGTLTQSLTPDAHSAPAKVAVTLASVTGLIFIVAVVALTISSLAAALSPPPTREAATERGDNVTQADEALLKAAKRRGMATLGGGAVLAFAVLRALGKH